MNKINIIFIITAISSLLSSNVLLAQNFHEVGLTDPTFAVTFVNTKSVNTSTDFKIYQLSANTIKFEVPAVNNLKIGLYDNYNNLVRSYIYNNLQAGSYEINFGSGNIKKGKYTCVMYSSSGVEQESSQINIE
jgi:hypothetical protein